MCEFQGFLRFERFQQGALKMAALQDDAVRHFDNQNNIQIQFVDEDDFPLASITEHQASDEEFYWSIRIPLRGFERRVGRGRQLSGIQQRKLV